MTNVPAAQQGGWASCRDSVPACPAWKPTGSLHLCLRAAGRSGIRQAAPTGQPRAPPVHRHAPTCVACSTGCPAAGKHLPGAVNDVAIIWLVLAGACTPRDRQHASHQKNLWCAACSAAGKHLQGAAAEVVTTRLMCASRRRAGRCWEAPKGSCRGRRAPSWNGGFR